MKRFKVLNVLVLILVLCLSGLSQEQNKTAEMAEMEKVARQKNIWPSNILLMSFSVTLDINLAHGFF